VIGNGDVGLMPPDSAKRDIICLFLGAAVPFVVQPNLISDDGV
jgi:hypothetical protein